MKGRPDNNIFVERKEQSLVEVGLRENKRGGIRESKYRYIYFQACVFLSFVDKGERRQEKLAQEEKNTKYERNNSKFVEIVQGGKEYL